MAEKKEKLLAGNPKMITYECTKKIIEQMERTICKIKIGKERATGFFCKIPFPNEKNMLPVFITNNHVIDEKLLYKKDANISIIIKEEKEKKDINLNERIKYTNKDYDVTIIEIKEKDNIKHYLELDDIIISGATEKEGNSNNEYEDKTIYIIQYPEGELSVSYGILGDIYVDKKYDFNHSCNTRKGSSGSPILNINNNKIIGIHKEEGNNNFNKGTFLDYPIKEFIQLDYNNNNNNKNEINKNKLREDNENALKEFNKNSNLNFKDMYPKNYMMEINKLILCPKPIISNLVNQKLKKEYDLCWQDTDLIHLGCKFGLDNGNIYFWKITMLGAKDTPYEWGLFRLIAHFPRDYPNHGPDIKFITKIYHLNVDPQTGHIDIGRFNDWRNFGKVYGFQFYTVKQALFDIFCFIFFKQDPDCAYDARMEFLYKNDEAKFYAEAKKWTKLYASY